MTQPDALDILTSLVDLLDAVSGGESGDLEYLRDDTIDTEERLDVAVAALREYRVDEANLVDALTIINA